MSQCQKCCEWKPLTEKPEPYEVVLVSDPRELDFSSRPPIRMTAVKSK